MVQKRKAYLLKVVLAGSDSARLSRGLHGRQEQANQRSDDGDHHQKLDEGKAGGPRSMCGTSVHDGLPL
jgi:hypothetical protein